MLIIKITKQMPIEVSEAITNIIDLRLQELNQQISSKTERLNTMRINIINNLSLKL